MANMKVGEAAVENSKQHDNEMFFHASCWLVLEGLLFFSLTWTMAPRNANVDTLSSKISGVQSKMRAEMVVLWIHIGLPPKKAKETP